MHMTTIDAFFDSIVLVYQVSGDAVKARRSEQLLKAGGLVSVQELNEFTAVMLRKLKYDWPRIVDALAGVRATCPIVPVTIEVHDRGLIFAERHGFHIYDAMIVAAAQLAGCTTLYSEDMQDGQSIDGLTIINPYAG